MLRNTVNVARDIMIPNSSDGWQFAKKVVSDSPGPLNFAIELVNSVLNMPWGKVKYLLGIQITEEL